MYLSPWFPVKLTLTRMFTAGGGTVLGRGLHSSTSQLNLSRF